MLGMIADAPTAALMLTQAVQKIDDRALGKSWTDAYLQERKVYLAARDEKALALANAEFIQPAALYHRLRSALPHDSVFTMDAGTLCLQATDNMNYHQAGSLYTPLDFGLVGFSFACQPNGQGP